MGAIREVTTRTLHGPSLRLEFGGDPAFQFFVKVQAAQQNTGSGSFLFDIPLPAHRVCSGAHRHHVPNGTRSTSVTICMLV